jgi:hypothetical protein
MITCAHPDVDREPIDVLRLELGIPRIVPGRILNIGAPADYVGATRSFLKWERMPG